MSSRKSAATSAHATDHAHGTAGLNDVPRHQIAAATQAACALFRGFESIRGIQQAAAHEALAHHLAMAERLKEPCEPMELLAVQADIARFDWQGAATYWQQLAIAVLGMEREMLACLAGASGEVLDAASKSPASVMPGMSPFFFHVEPTHASAAA